MIVGKWVHTNINDCFSMVAEYQKNGIKLVNVKFCNDLGNPTAASYKANWSIEGDMIKEVSFEASAYFTAVLGLTLPHTEKDRIKVLNDKELIIISAHGTNIYRRKEQTHNKAINSDHKKHGALF